MKAVVNSPQAITLEPMVTYRLESMGLIILTGEKAKPSCPLYQQYFSNNL
jgi:hypothetical protein